MTEGPIPLRVSNKKAYVWDVDDVARLRSRHGICGMLTGTLPHLSQQNVFLGKGLACLVDDKKAHYDPDLPQLAKWDHSRLKTIKHELALAEEEQEAKEHQYTTMTEESGTKTKRKGTEKSECCFISKRLISFLYGTSGKHARPILVHVAAPSSELEWYQQSLHSFTTLESAREAERARCAVFHDLREKGYYLGIGIKFGGDYLVYPGDPLRYHSHFVASVIPSPRTPLPPMEVVAHGRLGTGTKKSHLLCEWDEENDVVTCYSIEWAGFG
ncbi:tRNA intron endonuclease [Pisolithus marmoratus]|nr:tRNA intron endonuclease [Pisolithus marmoratus]